MCEELVRILRIMIIFSQVVIYDLILRDLVVEKPALVLHAI